MAYDLEEQEKLDAIKAWWARYGTVVISLVAAVALAWGGWWSWKAYESHRANQAMSYFEALEDAARLGTADSVVRIKTAAATLREQYGSTGYAARGALVAAQALLIQKDTDARARSSSNGWPPRTRTRPCSPSRACAWRVCCLTRSNTMPR